MSSNLIGGTNIMSKVISFQCDRCNALMLPEFVHRISIRIPKEPVSNREYCLKCLEHFFYSMQPINND